MPIKDIVFGPNGGGMTTSDLSWMTRRIKFSDYLPWIAYDPVTDIYLNADNTIGYLWECLPLCFAGEKTQSALEGLFRLGYPAGTVLQFILFADPNLESHLEAYHGNRSRDLPLARQTADEFSFFLKQATNESTFGAPLRNYRLFVALKMPSSADWVFSPAKHSGRQCLSSRLARPNM